MKVVRLCASCAPAPAAVLASHPGFRRLLEWKYRVRSWGRSFRLFAQSGPLFALLAMYLAYFPRTRELAVFAAAVAVVLLVSAEFLPTSPTTLGVFSAASSTAHPRATAALIMLVTAAAMYVFHCLLSIVEQGGNLAHDYGSSGHPENYWSYDTAPFLSSLVVVCPFMYFLSIRVQTASV